LISVESFAASLFFLSADMQSLHYELMNKKYFFQAQQGPKAENDTAQEDSDQIVRNPWFWISLLLVLGLTALGGFTLWQNGQLQALKVKPSAIPLNPFHSSDPTQTAQASSMGQTAQVGSGQTAQASSMGQTAQVTAGQTAHASSGQTAQVSSGQTAAVSTGQTATVSTGQTAQVSSVEQPKVVMEISHPVNCICQMCMTSQPSPFVSYHPLQRSNSFRASPEALKEERAEELMHKTAKLLVELQTQVRRLNRTASETYYKLPAPLTDVEQLSSLKLKSGHSRRREEGLPPLPPPPTRLSSLTPVATGDYENSTNRSERHRLPCPTP